MVASGQRLQLAVKFDEPGTAAAASARSASASTLGRPAAACRWHTRRLLPAVRNSDCVTSRVSRLILPRLCGVLAGLGDYASAMVISIAVS